MLNKKRILILWACGHKDEPLEIKSIKNQAELYWISVVEQCVNLKEDLESILNDNGEFEYIYLSAHWNNLWFCNEKKTLELEWFDFWTILCASWSLKQWWVLMLSCCRWWLNEVAYDMFWNCEFIEYIVWPRQSLTSADMLVGFQLLMYNLEYRNLDPIVACDRVLKWTDIRFKCFDRMETVSTTAYLRRADEWDNYENSINKENII